MKDYSKYLLVSDMDGTLMDDNGNTNDNDILAINNFIENGGLFGFATGRNPNALKEITSRTGTNIPSVLYNGALLYDLGKDKAYYMVSIDESCFEIVERVSNEHPEVLVEIHKDGDIFEYHTNKFTDFHRSIVDFTPHYINSLSDVPFPWIKIGFWTDEDKMDSLCKCIESINNGRFNFIRTHRFCCELLDKNADKGILLKQYRKLYPDRIIVACGDNDNDIQMLKEADLSFCPANAIKEVKQTVGAVLNSDCRHGCIAELISRL